MKAIKFENIIDIPKDTTGFIDVVYGDFYPLQLVCLDTSDTLFKNLFEIEVLKFSLYKYVISLCNDKESIIDFNKEFEKYESDIYSLKKYMSNKFRIIIYEGPKYNGFIPLNITKKALITLTYLNLINHENIDVEKQIQSLLLLKDKL